MADKPYGRWVSLALLLSAAVAAFAVFLGRSNPSPPKGIQHASSGMTASLQLPSAFGPAFAGEMIASRAGLFDQQGIHLDVRQAESSVDPIESVVQDVDTFGSARADRFLIARQKGARIVAIASSFMDTSAVFYSLKDAGVQTATDLIGRRIGTRTGDDTAIALSALISSLHLPESKLTILPVDDDLTMLTTHQIDVWPGHISHEDYALRQLSINYNVLSPDAFGVHLPGTVYFTEQKTIANRSDLVQKFVNSVIAGWSMVYRDINTSIPIITSFNKEKLSEDYVRFALERQRGLIRPGAIRIGELDTNKWRSLQNILIQQRILEKSIDLQSAITTIFIREAYRNARTQSP